MDERPHDVGNYWVAGEGVARNNVSTIKTGSRLPFLYQLPRPSALLTRYFEEYCRWMYQIALRRRLLTPDKVRKKKGREIIFSRTEEREEFLINLVNKIYRGHDKQESGIRLSAYGNFHIYKTFYTFASFIFHLPVPRHVTIYYW